MTLPEALDAMAQDVTLLNFALNFRDSQFTKGNEIGSWKIGKQIPETWNFLHEVMLEQAVLSASRLFDKSGKSLSLLNVHRRFPDVAFNPESAVEIFSPIEDDLTMWRNNIIAHTNSKNTRSHHASEADLTIQKLTSLA